MSPLSAVVVRGDSVGPPCWLEVESPLATSCKSVVWGRYERWLPFSLAAGFVERALRLRVECCQQNLEKRMIIQVPY